MAKKLSPTKSVSELTPLQQALKSRSAHLVMSQELKAESPAYLAARKAAGEFNSGTSTEKVALAKAAVIELVDQEKLWYIKDGQLVTGWAAVAKAVAWLETGDFVGHGVLKFVVALAAYMKVSGGKTPATGELKSI